MAEKKQRGIFTVAIDHIPGTEGAAEWQSSEDRIKELLRDVFSFVETVDRRSLQPGTAAMLTKLRATATYLRGEIEVDQRRDRWRIADYALQLGSLVRDVQANELLFNPLEGKRRSLGALPKARVEAAYKNRKPITVAKYKKAIAQSRGLRKNVAYFLRVSLPTLRTWEKANRMRKN